MKLKQCEGSVAQYGAAVPTCPPVSMWSYRPSLHTSGPTATALVPRIHQGSPVMFNAQSCLLYCLHRWKFIIIFFTTYVLQFCTFALIYLAFPSDCVKGIDGHFAHALWLSSRTASTLGFNEIYPTATCTGGNLVVMLQVNSALG
eukprot:GHUV01045046.1.p1 GENE.GHUV01045046.1~~GHUV01045046.1.p1  ORF type:complete len:145 (-),score=10.74 GHUV01045046.1:139-573(-)